MPGEVYGFEGAARRYAEAANRLFGMESGDAPLPPGFIFELDRPEWALLKRERLWSTGPQTIAASVGNLGRMQVQNPVKSGLIVVVRAFVVLGNEPAPTTYTISFDATGIVAGLQQNTVLDTRLPLTGGGLRTVAGSVNAIANNLPGLTGNAVDRLRTVTAAADVVSKGGPWVLGPGTLIEISSGTANQIETFLAYGYERPATPDELAA